MDRRFRGCHAAAQQVDQSLLIVNVLYARCVLLRMVGKRLSKQVAVVAARFADENLLGLDDVLKDPTS